MHYLDKLAMKSGVESLCKLPGPNQVVLIGPGQDRLLVLNLDRLQGPTLDGLVPPNWGRVQGPNLSTLIFTKLLSLITNLCYCS